LIVVTTCAVLDFLMRTSLLAFIIAQIKQQFDLVKQRIEAGNLYPLQEIGSVNLNPCRV
jgi:hypothetical protein